MKRLSGFVSMQSLIAGTGFTTIGALAGELATSPAAAVSEPIWIGLAIKLVTLFAGLVTILAGATKIYLDFRKDRREEREATISENDIVQERHEHQE